MTLSATDSTFYRLSSAPHIAFLKQTMKRTALIYSLFVLWLIFSVLPVISVALLKARIPMGNVIVFHIVGIVAACAAYMLGKRSPANVTLWVSRIPIYVEGILVVLIAAVFVYWFFAPGPQR